MYEPHPATTDTRFPEALDGLPLLTMNKEGEVPPSRVSKVSSARAMFVRMRDDDDVNRQNRALMQLLRDGDPPWDEAALKENGQPDTTNLNFQGAEERAEKAKAPYYALVRDTEDLVHTPTLYGDEDSRIEWAETLSEEISKTIRGYKQFSFHTERLIDKHVWDGLGVCHFPDELDWRYRSAGLGQFLFPRQAVACEDELEYCACIEEYTVTRLYNAIKNEEAACRNGWCVPAAKAAIRAATSAQPNYQDWERLTDEMKNNDLSVSNTAQSIRMINLWTKEFGGKVSHYMFPETPTAEGDENNEQFVYCCRGKYASMQQAMVLFPYGLGTNQKIHGIRGLGFKVYAFEQQRNRSLCRLIDVGNLASSLMMQAEDETALNAMGLQFFGNTAVLDPKAKVVQYTAPDLNRSVMPVIEMMDRLRDDRTEAYTPDAAFGGDQRKTKFEVSARMQEKASLSGTALDFWNGPYERVLQEVVRRMIRRTFVPEDPGGREIADLKLRLLKRGVPLEAFYQIDVRNVRLVTPVGNGDASARTLGLARLSELKPDMDDVARAKLNRMMAIDAVGVAWANVFFPRDGVKRTTADTSIALLQNEILLQGGNIPVLPSENHLAHVREHIKPLIEGFQAEQQGQVETAVIGPKMAPLFNHAVEHMDGVGGDPNTEQEAAGLRQVLQQIGEVVSNGLKAAQKLAEEQEQQAAEEGAAGAAGFDGPPPEYLAEVERSREKLRQEQEAHEMRLRQLEETAETKRRIADADAAARISREERMMSVKERAAAAKAANRPAAKK